MTLLDVVSPAPTALVAPNQAPVQPIISSVPVQPATASAVVQQQAPLDGQPESHAPPGSSAQVSSAPVFEAQSVLPRKPRTNPVVRTKISNAPFFEPPPTAPRK